VKESYTSQPIGVRARCREFMRLWNFHNTAAPNRVRTLVGLAEDCSNRLKQVFDFELSGRRILDVGPGQFLIQSRFFALYNNVVGIDSDVIADGLKLGTVVDMIHHNGLHRAIKTVARKTVGIDRAYARALRKALGVDALPKIDLRRGDACRMQFPDESFEMIYSRAVLNHLAAPAVALSEMARVLKPGGVAHVDLHLYSSLNGSLDPRSVDATDPELYWAHLREGCSVIEGASLNKLRLSEWRALFADSWPGSIVDVVQSDNPAIHQKAEKLLAEQKIRGYSKEELVTTTVTAIWQKPQLSPSFRERVLGLE
jgi:SAM-dependent methyltransferase